MDVTGEVALEMQGADHITISKFDNSSSGKWILLRNELKEVVDGLQAFRLHSSEKISLSIPPKAPVEAVPVGE